MPEIKFQIFLKPNTISNLKNVVYDLANILNVDDWDLDLVDDNIIHFNSSTGCHIHYSPINHNNNMILKTNSLSFIKHCRNIIFTKIK